MTEWAKAADGATVCMRCGKAWSGHDRRLWWPIRLRWSAWWSPPFTRHGVQQGVDSRGRRLFSTTFHFGRLKVLVGVRKGWRPVAQHCPGCRALHWVPAA